MNSFSINGYEWNVVYVDPGDYRLIDRTGVLTLATTDPSTNCVYISDALYGNHLRRVLIHEIGHCTLLSFHLDIQIRRMVHPEYWIECEEFICNFLADYGEVIFRIAYSIVGQDAIEYVPRELERYMGVMQL